MLWTQQQWHVVVPVGIAHVERDVTSKKTAWGCPVAMVSAASNVNRVRASSRVGQGGLLVVSARDRAPIARQPHYQDDHVPALAGRRIEHEW
jgi:hypothetical protein